MKSYDLICIGGGSGGFNAARTAQALGAKVAIIDGANKLGGLCILNGCMPSKALLWSTEVLHNSKHGSLYGLRIPIAEPNIKEILRRKNKLISDFAKHRLQQLTSDKFDLYRSNARFRSSTEIELEDGTVLSADKFLVSTGSIVATPNIPGLESKNILISGDVLALKVIPLSIIILGGGVVACELSQYMRRLGSKVIQIQRNPRLLKEFSPQSSAELQRSFNDEGISVFTDTELLSLQAKGRQSSVLFKKRGTHEVICKTADAVLNALGRSPNTANLGLDKANVKLDESGRILVNQWQQTSNRRIYAAGDVCGPYDVVHLAVAQGELAARHALGVPKCKPINYDLNLAVVFTDPQIARIGLTETEITRRKIKYCKATYPFNDHGKSIIMKADYGHVTILAETPSGRLLGAEIAGRDAGELIHCFNTPLYLKATIWDMLAAPWYHPTLAEIITYPLEEIADQLK